MNTPFSQACENNKQPILAVLQDCFIDRRHVLEVGSGTGQHAVFFAKHLPHLVWQSSDQAMYLEGISQQFAAHPEVNLPAPLTLDVRYDWPRTVNAFDSAFTANTLHIMDPSMVMALFRGLGQQLASQAELVIYGPFNYQGQYTSDSNREFDFWLKRRDPDSGIRDIEWVQTLATQQGFQLRQDHPMPANNRLLHFSR